MTADAISARGWDAIDAACQALYPDEEPQHFGTSRDQRGSPGLLDGISVWKRLLPIPHWHFVTYGLSELFDKETQDEKVSGFGFELTFRLKCKADAARPPNWALNFLLNLSRYVYSSGHGFDSGHRMATNGPIAAGSNSLLHGIALFPDPEIPSIGTPNGRVEFLQVVGMTLDELAAAKRWSTADVLVVFLPFMPLWTTDLDRPSLLERDDIRRLVEEGARRDGSSADTLLVEELMWRLDELGMTVMLGASQVKELVVLLPLRLPFGRPYTVRSGDKALEMASAYRNARRVDGDTLELDLTDETVREIVSRVQPRAGIYGIPSFAGLRFVVQTSRIRKMSGEVVETIG